MRDGVETVSEVVGLALLEARRLQESFPALFGSAPVQASKIAKILGIPVQRRGGISGRAKLEVYREPEGLRCVIVVRSDVLPNVGRFAIAHEIGHALLLCQHSEMARRLSLDQRERFADRFASELLVPPLLRDRLRKEFRALDNPRGLKALASGLGLSPTAVLTFAAREPGWFSGLNTIWLRVKHMVNRRTGRKPCLRIDSAYYDRNTFYVAWNQSLHKFCSTDWLALLDTGDTAAYTGNIRLPQRKLDAVRRYNVAVEARLEALRLDSGDSDKAAYMIISALLCDDIHNNGGRSVIRDRVPIIG